MMWRREDCVYIFLDHMLFVSGSVRDEGLKLKLKIAEKMEFEKKSPSAVTKATLGAITSNQYPGMNG